MGMPASVQAEYDRSQGQQLRDSTYLHVVGRTSKPSGFACGDAAELGICTAAASAGTGAWAGGFNAAVCVGTGRSAGAWGVSLAWEWSSGRRCEELAMAADCHSTYSACHLNIRARARCMTCCRSLVSC